MAPKPESPQKALVAAAQTCSQEQKLGYLGMTAETRWARASGGWRKNSDSDWPSGAETDQDESHVGEWRSTESHSKSMKVGYL